VSTPLASLRFFPFAAALTFAGAALAAPPAEGPQPNSAAAAAEMMIEAGRLGVMLDQADAAMKLHAGDPSEEPVETPGQQQIYVVHELRAAVLRYNMMQFDACRGGTVAGEVCAQPYLPDWLKEPPDAVPPGATIAARVQDAVNHIMPFWKAMCAKAVAQTHDETFCAIE